MPLFAIIARDRPGSLGLRQETRPAHVEHLESLGDRLLVAGPTMDGDGDPDGSLVIIEADRIEEAQAFAEADPYRKVDLFERVDVRAWTAPLGVWSKA